ncbi:MAG: hypothetical protein OHK0013_17270 [Sandaracinaceae bacterium]
MGEDTPKVDSRFLQANERTLLAWIRMGLGFLGFGLVLERGLLAGMAGPPDDSPVLRIAGLLLMMLGPVSTLLGVYRYHRVHQALVAHEDVRLGAGPAIAVAIVVSVFGLALTALVMTL